MSRSLRRPWSLPAARRAAGSSRLGLAAPTLAALVLLLGAILPGAGPAAAAIAGGVQ